MESGCCPLARVLLQTLADLEAHMQVRAIERARLRASSGLSLCGPCRTVMLHGVASCDLV
eukprot:1459543-Alexandrium_andersonii.AAC.1